MGHKEKICATSLDAKLQTNDIKLPLIDLAY